MPWLRALRRRLLRSPRILVIDDFLPDPRFGAGTPRETQFLRAMSSSGAATTLWPTAPAFAGIDVDLKSLHGAIVPDRHNRDLAGFLAANPNAFDVIVVSRPHNMRQFHAISAGNPAVIGSAQLIYDAEALFAERTIIMQAVLGKPFDAANAKQMLDEELSLSRGADVVLAINAQTAAAFQAAGHPDVRVLGYCATAAHIGQGFDQRDGFLFVGPTRSDTEPNGDSVIWFIDHVMPRLRATFARDVSFAIAGMTGAPLVMQRAGGNIKLLGVVDELADTYAAARVFVAPTRFAAGAPLKVYDAAVHGLPTVITPLLARQTGWTHERETLVAQTFDEFAAACFRLHEDRALWQRIRTAALSRVAKDCSPVIFDRRVAKLVSSSRWRTIRE